MEEIIDKRTKIFDDSVKTSIHPPEMKERAKPSYNIHEKNCGKIVEEHRVYGNGETDFLTCRFDAQDEMIAAGGANGFVNVYFLETNKHEALHASEGTGYPITSLRWHPPGSNTNKSILITGCCDGTISHYDGKTGKLLREFLEKDNQVLCLDVRLDGIKFASAGKDRTVRIYDEFKEVLDCSMSPGTWNQLGHSNRIFSVKFHPEMPNVLMSGGWDRTVIFWDTRQKDALGSIFGPKICGDTIDVCNNMVLTGSYANNNQLELWDLTTRKKIRDVFWENDHNPEDALVYGCQFSKKDGRTIIAGCAGRDEIRCFDSYDDYKYFGTTGDFKHCIFSLDFANKSDLFAFTGSDGHLHTAEIKNSKFYI